MDRRSDEIERRTKARLRKGDAADRVEAGVVDELARELIEGVASAWCFGRMTSRTNNRVLMAAE